MAVTESTVATDGPGPAAPMAVRLLGVHQAYERAGTRIAAAHRPGPPLRFDALDPVLVLLAASFPAWRTSRIDPAAALRYG